MSDAEPYVCEHCDDSVPHQHVDERPLVEAYRRALLVAGLGTVALGVFGLVVSVVVSSGRWALPLGAVAYVVATLVGLLVLRLLAGRRSSAVAVIVGAIASAAVSPLLALGVAALSPVGAGLAAVTAGTGWLLTSALVTLLRARQLRRQLAAHTRDGEAARSAVVQSAGRPSPYVEGVWLVLTAVAFAVCVAAAALLPAVVVVLVPLNVALAVLSRRSHAVAARAAARPTVGATS